MWTQCKLNAKERLAGQYWMAVLVSLVAAMLGADGANPSASFSFNSQRAASFFENLEMSKLMLALASLLTGLIFIAGIAFFLLGSAVLLGKNLYYIRVACGEKPRFQTLFERMRQILKVAGLRIFKGLFVFLWSLLLIVPGIIAAMRYAMAEYVMAENPDISITGAVNRSKELMRGRLGDFFILGLSFIGWILLAILTCGIGFYFLNPYIQASYASFYLKVSGRLS